MMKSTFDIAYYRYRCSDIGGYGSPHLSLLKFTSTIDGFSRVLDLGSVWGGGS